MEVDEHAGAVDYLVTSRRPEWSQLPEPVRAEAARVAGSAVVEAAPVVTSGFTGSYAGRVRLADDREVFVKAGGPDMPHVVGALAQEAGVLAALPTGVPAPRLVGFDRVEGWSVLVLEAIDGRQPGGPWTAADIEAVHTACLDLADLTTPVPDAPVLRAPGLGTAMGRDEEIRAFARGVADGSTTIPRWAGGERVGHVARRELSRLTLACEALVVGDTLCHGDLRPDNLLVDRSGTAWLVDWNWVGSGPRWLDLVGLLPIMRAQGVDTDALERRSPLLLGADPEAVDAFLAAVVCYMLGSVDRPPPAGCTPALRAHQRLFATVFLGHLTHRRRWQA